jgi:alkanesulfonate monooxygenase SsuD/methylene tetrahydromethanopterin reductase-like flavin-dependent oxidoreductase (luciferase family)
MTEPPRQPPLGFALRDPYPWPELAAVVAAGERAGFQALFLPEVGVRDTLAALTALAGETDRLLLGTGVVPLPARSPSLLAMAAATAQERSGGRLLLGLGTGPSVPGALDRLRATVLALRTAFAGGSGEVDGDPVRTGLPLPAIPQIWIAALGPRATRLAGEVADGVLLNWCTPERVASAISQLAGGAARAGRDPLDVTVGVYIRAALAEGSGAAARTVAAEYASYPAYRRQFLTMGLDPSNPDAIVRGVMLDDAAMARDRLEAYRAAGADLPIVYPVLPAGPPSAAAALDTLRAIAPGAI